MASLDSQFALEIAYLCLPNFAHLAFTQAPEIWILVFTLA